ncbi:hypothetical protein WA1_39970 [Scytonema hofmannii PCC 7110]|uniref:Bacteriocin immunity protein n=2 Tax=Scytonema hofmannii TaxID=34078 RepID=A0A139WYW9_9CYAN|nr:hypothetical protein [Scytonema hofmannii]KYC37641.1 hypothetical protein WA1_39970 [Scytonema hofmannii PCC 7110]
MTNTELKQYISQHRNNDEAFRAVLEVLMSRHDPNAPYQAYPFELTDPKSKVEALLIEKIKQAEQ